MIAFLLYKLLRIKEGTTSLAETMREKKKDLDRRRGGREARRGKEQGRVSPGKKLEIMDLFDIRPQSG